MPIDGAYIFPGAFAYINPQTPAEQSAGVVPTSYAYPPGDVRRYGADPTGVAASATAIGNALKSLPSTGGQVYFAPGIYLCDSSVTASVANTTLWAEDGAQFKTNGNTGIIGTADNLTIVGLTFISLQSASASSDIFVQHNDHNGLTIRFCTIGRGRIYHRSTTGSPILRCKIESNWFNGDFTGSSGADVNDVIDIRGCQDVQITSNLFTTSYWYNLIKLSSSTGDSAPFSVRCQRVVIDGNVFDCTSNTAGGAIMDLYASTEYLSVCNNQFNITDSSGTIIPISSKPNGASGTAPYGEHYLIANNSFRIGANVTTAIVAQGAWGITGFTVNGKCVVTGNVIERTSSNTAAAIDVKGWNDAIVTQNIYQAPAVAFALSILAGNNQRCTIANNSIEFGTISLVGNASDQNGDSYANQPQYLSVSGNVIDDFNSPGCIQLSGITTCDQIHIANNGLRNQTDTANIAGAIWFSTVTCTTLAISDNTSAMASAGKNGLSGTPTVTNYRMHDNSWQVVTATFDPANVASGAATGATNFTVNGCAFGDQAFASAPYDLQGLQCTAYVQAANTIAVQFYNLTGGAINLASGTWRIGYRKQ